MGTFGVLHFEKSSNLANNDEKSCSICLKPFSQYILQVSETRFSGIPFCHNLLVYTFVTYYAIFFFVLRTLFNKRIWNRIAYCILICPEWINAKCTFRIVLNFRVSVEEEAQSFKLLQWEKKTPPIYENDLSDQEK